MVVRYSESRTGSCRVLIAARAHAVSAACRQFEKIWPHSPTLWPLSSWIPWCPSSPERGNNSLDLDLQTKCLLCKVVKPQHATTLSSAFCAATNWAFSLKHNKLCKSGSLVLRQRSCALYKINLNSTTQQLHALLRRFVADSRLAYRQRRKLTTLRKGQHSQCLIGLDSRKSFLGRAVRFCKSCSWQGPISSPLRFLQQSLSSLPLLKSWQWWL